MAIYKNIPGKSGVTAYEIGNNYNKVQFIDRKTHTNLW